MRDQNTAIEEMQKAVDIVNTSPHPTNKIAATLFGRDFSLSCTNQWPEKIMAAFGPDTDVGNSSGTLHAETACIMAAGKAGHSIEGASLCITDPFCPNCAKNIAEAGVKTIYIDHKGFEKDFAQRRGDHFENMSMQICERAGISVYEVRRKEGKVIPILEIPDDYNPPNDCPVVISALDCINDAVFLDLIADARANLRGERFALALCRSFNGRMAALCARAHLAIGYTTRIDAEELHNPQGKYTFVLEPSNRVLMNAARLGCYPDPAYFYASSVPTSRELVNLVGAGVEILHLGDAAQARDEESTMAIKQLSDGDVLEII